MRLPQVHDRQRDGDRPSARARGYDATWRRLRHMKLLADPICQLGIVCGGRAWAEEVDHIIPIARAPELRLETRNLQSVCRKCHRMKTLAER